MSVFLLVNDNDSYLEFSGVFPRHGVILTLFIIRIQQKKGINFVTVIRPLKTLHKETGVRDSTQ